MPITAFGDGRSWATCYRLFDLRTSLIGVAKKEQGCCEQASGQNAGIAHVEISFESRWGGKVQRPLEIFPRGSPFAQPPHHLADVRVGDKLVHGVASRVSQAKESLAHFLCFMDLSPKQKEATGSSEQFAQLGGISERLARSYGLFEGFFHGGCRGPEDGSMRGHQNELKFKLAPGALSARSLVV